MRRLLAVALLATLVAPPASAQPAPAPAVEVRLRGVSDLLDRLEYLAKLVDQEDAGNQLAQTVQSFADAKKGIEGIDPARPIGLYATVAPNPLESQVVVLLPIADEKAFLELLTGKLSLDPKKQDGGVYQLQVPNVPLPLFFAFADKTCYVTVGSAAALEAKTRIAPKAFFAADDGGVLSVNVRLDRLPADIKKTALGQIELKLADAKDKKEPNETPAQTALKGWLTDRASEAVAAVFADGREFSVRLTADPKGDDLALEVGLSANPGSALAKTFAGLGTSSRTTTTAVPTAGSLATFGITGAFGPKSKASLGPVVDALLAEAVANAKEGERPMVKMVLAALAPTLKSGLIDLNLAVTGAGKPDRFRVLAAAAVADGAGIEKTAKQIAPFVPEEAVKFAFDQGSAGGLTLHKLTTSDPKFNEAFDTDSVWLATGDSKLVVGFEPAAVGVKAAATADPKPAPLMAGTLSVARLMEAAKDGLPAETGKKLVTQVFGDAGPAGKDTVSMRLEGGESLKLRLIAKGKALQLAVLTDKERKKKD